RHESGTRRVTQGARSRQQAGAERRAADPGGRRAAARGDLPAVGRIRKNARRRAVEALRGSAAPGEAGTGHQAAARLRSGLIVKRWTGAARLGVFAALVACIVDGPVAGAQTPSRSGAVQGFVSTLQSTPLAGVDVTILDAVG